MLKEAFVADPKRKDKIKKRKNYENVSRGVSIFASAACFKRRGGQKTLTLSTFFLSITKVENDAPFCLALGYKMPKHFGL